MFIGRGLINGINASVDDVKSAASQLANATLLNPTASYALSGGALSGLPGSVPVDVTVTSQAFLDGNVIYENQQKVSKQRAARGF